MIKPYFDASYDNDLGLLGIVFTCGFLIEEKCFQIALTLGGLTLAIGIAFSR